MLGITQFISGFNAIEHPTGTGAHNVTGKTNRTELEGVDAMRQPTSA